MNDLSQPVVSRTATDVRRVGYPIEALFTQRWSPRSFDRAPMPVDDLMTIFEAARWAPSAYNVQPWRFVYAMRDDAYWQAFIGLLDPFNASWAANASALVFILSDRFSGDETKESLRPFPSHSFDAGAAWAQLALQATAMGYQAHAMGGIHHDRVREALGVPERFKVEIGVAVGTQACVEKLPAELQQREVPSERKALSEIVSAGRLVLPND
ncbi:nitroreductase family protein [Motiliproteus sediminis]|uniref:nitroreductase family protein n=1 Tax=Motiliproteus sediminis TaxID=1468178 RepID=UPI001AEF9A42|nr:nitroreductase family protein [Motiliproteus sediminis]